MLEVKEAFIPIRHLGAPTEAVSNHVLEVRRFADYSQGDKLASKAPAFATTAPFWFI